MTNWHRIFGLALTDLFTGSPYAIESEIPKMKQNAFWCLLSSKSELIDWGVENYHQRTQNMSTVIKQMIDMYKMEGITVSYTFEDFHRDLAREHLHLLSPNEVLSHYKSDEVLSYYKPDEVLSHYKPEERLYGLPLEQRLAGLTADQIRVYLEKLEQSK